MQSTWLNKRAISLHITAAILIPTFIILGRWQLLRAVHGNALSWAYTFEWPLFAIYGTYMWWKLVHDVSPVAKQIRESNDDPASDNKRARRRRATQKADDEQLLAYNAYLAQLHHEDEAEKNSTNGS